MNVIKLKELLPPDELVKELNEKESEIELIIRRLEANPDLVNTILQSYKGNESTPTLNENALKNPRLLRALATMLLGMGITSSSLGSEDAGEKIKAAFSRNAPKRSKNDTPAVSFVMPPQKNPYEKAASQTAGKQYDKAASDAAGKTSTRSNTNVDANIKANPAKLNNAIDILNGSGTLIKKAMDLIRPEENNKKLTSVKVDGKTYTNYDPKGDRWHPYPDNKGWSIGYGHWSPTRPSGPISDKQAEMNLKNDVESKINLARRLLRNFDNLPQSVQLAVVNSLYRGEKSPKAFAELNKPNPNFNVAAQLYITTKDTSALGRMKVNAALIALGSQTKK